MEIGIGKIKFIYIRGRRVKGVTNDFFHMFAYTMEIHLSIDRSNSDGNVWIFRFSTTT